jgi:hypothetical protein
VRAPAGLRRPGGERRRSGLRVQLDGVRRDPARGPGAHGLGRTQPGQGAHHGVHPVSTTSWAARRSTWTAWSTASRRPAGSI